MGGIYFNCGLVLLCFVFGFALLLAGLDCWNSVTCALVCLLVWLFSDGLLDCGLVPGVYYLCLLGLMVDCGCLLLVSVLVYCWFVVLLLGLVRVFLFMIVGFCYLVWVLLFGSLLYSCVCYGLLGWLAVGAVY